MLAVDTSDTCIHLLLVERVGCDVRLGSSELSQVLFRVS